MAWLGAVCSLLSALGARLRHARHGTAGQICFVRPSIVVLIALETGNRHLPLATGVSELIPTPS